MNRSVSAALSALMFVSMAAAAHGARKNPCVGKILKSAGGKTLLEAGDSVTIVFKKNRSLSVGTRLTAYRMSPDLMNTRTDSEREKRIEEKLGTIEILKLDGEWYALGNVVLVLGDLEPGSLLKPETSPVPGAK